ncbi:MAG: hypothetical protein KAW09_01245 [Thermoplasmata archaeon]|nr:hypothetical protein [Thermoplasmata archaeon]
MESQASSSALEKPHRWLIFTVLGFLGLVLGMFVPFAAGIGMLLLSAGALLWFTALLGRKDTAWSSEVNYYGELLVVFGAMAVLGSGLGMWIQILS